MASFTISEMSLLHTSPFERVILSNGGNCLVVNQILPENLRAAYKEIKALCDTMNTPVRIHSFAREYYEKVYQSGEFVSEPQKKMIAGCLFIAYKATDADQDCQDRKISYRERSNLAPATDHDLLRLFAALESFFKFKATKAFFGDGDEAMDQAAVGQAKGRNSAAKEDENANVADYSVDNSTKLLLAASKRIDAFCQCFSLPLPVTRHITAHSMFLYKKIHLSGGFEKDEEEAVLAGCFYLAFRQVEVPCTFREVWIMTRVPIEEIEAVVKDLENFFAEEVKFQTQSREEARDLPREP